MTAKQKLAVVKAVIALNAALLGEEVQLVVSVRPKGWIAVKWVPGHPQRSRFNVKEYPNIDLALAAAWVSLDRARQVAEYRDHTIITPWPLPLKEFDPADYSDAGSAVPG